MNERNMEDATRFKKYLIQFVDTLHPLLQTVIANESDFTLARLYLQSQTAQHLLQTYRRQVEMQFDNRPAWHWIVKGNDDMLVAHPELIVGVDSEKLKFLTQLWATKLNPKQKATIFQWLLGMVHLAGFDVESVH